MSYIEWAPVVSCLLCIRNIWLIAANFPDTRSMRAPSTICAIRGKRYPLKRNRYGWEKENVYGPIISIEGFQWRRPTFIGSIRKYHVYVTKDKESTKLQ